MRNIENTATPIFETPEKKGQAHQNEPDVAGGDDHLGPWPYCRQVAKIVEKALRLVEVFDHIQGYYVIETSSPEIRNSLVQISDDKPFIYGGHRPARDIDAHNPAILCRL